MSRLFDKNPVSDFMRCGAEDGVGSINAAMPRRADVVHAVASLGSSQVEPLSDPQINQPTPVGPFESPVDSRLSDQSCRRAAAS